jgi:hypothetical protein
MPLYRFPNKIVLFVHIPKAGGTSVEEMLRAAGGHEALRSKGERKPLGVSPQHLHAEVLADYVPPSFYDLSFALCRNPYDRIFSEYKMRSVAPGKGLGFDEWFEEAIGRFDTRATANDNHLRRQCEFPVKGGLVFRLEDGIERAVADVCARVGVSTPSEAPRRQEVAHPPVPAKRSTLARIGKVYAKDFRTFGYDAADWRRSFSEVK